MAALAIALGTVAVLAFTRGRGPTRARLSVLDRSTGTLVATAALDAGWAEGVWLGVHPGDAVVATCNPLAWFRVDLATGRTLDRQPYGGTRMSAASGLLPRWPVNTRESSAITVATPTPPEGGVTRAVGSDELVWEIATERVVSKAGWSVAAPKERGKNIVFLVTDTRVVLVWNATTEGCPASG